MFFAAFDIERYFLQGVNLQLLLSDKLCVVTIFVCFFDLACFGCRSVQRSTRRDKNMRQRAKIHTFFYKYVTPPRLLSFSEKKSIKFIDYITS